MSPHEAFGIFTILVGLAAPIIVIGVVYYLKKRLEHKQIMAAIEKGTPLSELRSPKQNGALWIRSLTVGIVLLILGLAFAVVGPRGLAGPMRPSGPFLFVAFILCGIGLAWVIRGLLYRKYQPQNRSSAKGAENRNASGASASDALQRTNE